MTLPGPAFTKRLRSSGLLLDWRARDLTLVPRSGQVPSFVRASVAGRVLDEDGRFAGAAVHSQPRWSEGGSDGLFAETFLQLERAKTNSFGDFSEDLSNGAWTKTNLTVATNTILAPDGTLAADKLLETATTAAHSISRTLPALTNNLRATVLVCARGGLGRDWVRIRTLGKDNNPKDSWIDITNQVTGTIDASHKVVVRRLAYGFTGIWLSWDPVSGGTTPTATIGLATADNNTSTYLGDITKGFYLWGIQFVPDLEDFGSYHNFNTATADDQLSWSIDFPPPSQGEELTVLVEYDPLWGRTGAASSNPGILNIGGTGSFVGDGKVCLDVLRDQTTANLRTRLNSDSTTIEPGSLAIPSSGVIQHLIQIRASGTEHLLYHEVNGGAGQVTGPTAYLLGRGWRQTSLAIAARGNGVDTGSALFRGVKVQRGRFTLAQMLGLS